MRKALGLLAVAVVLVAIAGCGAGGAPGQGLTVTDAWVRLPTGTGEPAAAYFVIHNNGTGADALVSASSNSAGSATIHQSGMDSTGMVGMTPVDRVEVAPGQTVTFAPGGYHVMLEGLTRQLTVGQSIELSLTFEKAGKIEISAVVKAG